MENLHRDEATVPLVARALRRLPRLPGRGARASCCAAAPNVAAHRDETRAAIGHALAFSTWHSLTREQGLDDAQAAELMCRLAAG